MRVSFIFPTALWLFALLIPLWWLTLAVPRRLSAPRFWASLLARTALVGTLVFAVAGAQLIQPTDRLTTVFLIDSSDSVSPSARGQAEAFVQDALKAMRPGDQAAVVVFGENALVERAPSDATTLGRLGSTPVAARTNLQEAVQLGLALLPADSEQRLVLLSDGGENQGNVLEGSSLAAARGVPISFVDFNTSGGGPEALISAIDAPTNVRAGAQFDLVTTVESTVAQSARLSLFGDDSLLQARDVQLQAGVNTFRLTLTAAGQGFQRYRAQIVPELDFRRQNNEAATLVRVAGSPRVLLVEGQPGEGENFKDALSAARIGADLIAPEHLPTDVASLSDYDAVMLMNVPAQALPARAAANLPIYVRELGRGLVMVGGDRSYGVGGYGATPIEQALPVYMDVRDRQERPDLALVFVIDKSGSMDACHCSGPNRQTARSFEGGPRKVDIAKDAIVQATAVLRERDTVGVVAFDSTAHWALPAGLRGPNSDAIRYAVAPIEPEGGTNVHAGLVAAQEALQRADARIKHVILLTDGWSGGGDNLDVAQQMRAQGITLSVVAAGGGSADYLKQVADAGGGRYYPIQNIEDVPQIFVQETTTAVGNYLIEEPFTPKYAGPSPILEQLDQGLPPLYGYNGTTLKQSATTVLAGADDAPVLAQWQYGIGRAVAWTSDFKGKWGKDWVNWTAFPRFAAQLIGWTLPSAAGDGVETNIRTAGARTIIDVKLTDADGKPRNGLQIGANVVGANAFAQETSLTQVAPGEYRASIASPIQGTYVIQIAGAQDGRVVVQSAAGMVVPYSAEYRLGQRNPELLAALAHSTGGAKLEQPADAFAHNLALVYSAREIALPLLLLALLLLPLDIAVRRLMLRRGDLGAATAWMRTARFAPETPATDRLRQRDSRAKNPARGASAEQIERLRAAKARARRKARGDEETTDDRP
jgi:Ca-activated chloride channel family protein